MDTCASCRFFSRHDETQGACRRRSPVVISVSDPDPLARSPAPMVSLSVWPMIGETDWCGEFEARRGH